MSADTQAPGAIIAPRGCGKARTAGGVYAEVGSSEGGQPVEYFLCDPPVLVPEGMDLPNQGVTLYTRDGITHIVDRVGLVHYPNVADYVEEVRRLGVSRRLQWNLDYSLLSEHSHILLVHPRAWIENASAYRLARAYTERDGPYRCPKDKRPHTFGQNDTRPGPCAGLWWEDVSGGVQIAPHTDERLVTRTMPAFAYDGRMAPSGVRGQYREAIFASFPLSRLAVVRDQSSAKAHETAMLLAGRAAANRLPVDLVGE